MLSAEYGWLPSQIRKEDENDIYDYINIIQTKRFIENNQNKKR